MHEVLLDCLVYAPVGAAIVVFEEVPRLAERGRERVDKQVAIARLLGRFAVREGQRRLRPPGSSSPREDAAPPDPHAAPPDPQGEAAEGSTEPAAPVPEVADSGGTEEVLTHTPPPEAPSEDDSGGEAASGDLESASVPSEPSEPSEPVPGPLGRELPIPAYDTLAASQVVERLTSLTPDELEAVRRHESATRRRRTVLHRIAQLNSERDGAQA